jgi:hypothetical protein
MGKKTFYKVANGVFKSLKQDRLLVTTGNIDDSKVFELSGPGLDIWEALEKGKTFDELIELLEEEWEDFGSNEHQEVRALLEALIDQGLVISKP